MRKFFICSLVGISLLLSSCSSITAVTDPVMTLSSSQNTETSDNIIIESATTDETGNQSIEVDKNLLSVKITLPASMIDLSTTSQDEIAQEAKASGISDVVFNEDGSVTYTMTKSVHQKMLDEMKISIDESIAEMLSETDTSFVEITYNDNCSEFLVKVDGTKYSEMDSFAALTFYVIGGYYQTFMGVNSDDTTVIVKFIDNDTGEVLNTADSSEMND